MQLLTIITLLGSIKVCNIIMCFTMYLCSFLGHKLKIQLQEKEPKHNHLGRTSVTQGEIQEIITMYLCKTASLGFSL